MIKNITTGTIIKAKPKLLISSNIKNLFSDTVPTSLQDTLTRENSTLNTSIINTMIINQIKIITHNSVIMQTILDKILY